MPSSGMTFRTSCTMRCGVGGQRSSVCPVGKALQNAFAKAEQCPGIVQSSLDAIRQQFQARPDIANHLALRKVNPLHIGRRVADVDHLGTLRAHDERRFLDRIVTDGDDQIGAINGFMHVVTFAERSRPHIEVATPGYGSLPHLRREEWNLRAADEPSDTCRAPGPGRGGAEHDQWPLGLEDHFSGAVQRSTMCDRNFDRMLRHHRDVFRLFARDVLRQFQQDRTRPLFHGDPKGIANDRRNTARTDDLERKLGQRLESTDHIDDLELGLPAAHDALLPGEHDHRHGTEQRIGCSRRQVQRARTKRGDAHTGLAGQPPVSRGHEGRALLVAGQDQLDRRVAQAFHDIQVLLAGNPENPVDALVLECGNQ